MTSPTTPLRFGHHALAVLGAAMLAATGFAVATILLIRFLAGRDVPGPAWLAITALMVWLAFFLILLPGAGLIFSLLWPVTRRRTAAGAWICLLAGAATGMLLAPLASPGGHGASLRQLGLFLTFGIVTAALYLFLARRLAQGKRIAPMSPQPRLAEDESTAIAA